MNFNFRHVEVFWAVMSTGSATAAAAMLHTSQPTISRELGRFEHVTGLTLFQRTGAKLVPTEQALMLFEEVQRSYVGLQRIASAADGIRHHRHSQLSITCLPAFSHGLLPQVCRLARQRHPGISVSIAPQEAPALQESLSAQRYHLGLTEDLAAPPGTAIETLLLEDVVCVLPAGHPLCAREVLAPEDFEGRDVVCLAPEDPYRLRTDSLFRERGVERRMVVETLSASAVCATVNLGVGMAIVNPLTALEYAPRGLEIRRFSESIPYAVSLVLPSHRPASDSVARFAAALRDTCAEIGEALRTLAGPRA
ncbi:LysR family transcriptional regulator [Pseudoduganella namucuonensis]|nr:LysR family transcriptional regulator [Pseudoduganella namucuonensis]